jgi:hypothetical protein
VPQRLDRVAARFDDRLSESTARIQYDRRVPIFERRVYGRKARIGIELEIVEEHFDDGNEHQVTPVLARQLDELILYTGLFAGEPDDDLPVPFTPLVAEKIDGVLARERVFDGVAFPRRIDALPYLRERNSVPVADIANGERLDEIKERNNFLGRIAQLPLDDRLSFGISEDPSRHELLGDARVERSLRW